MCSDFEALSRSVVQVSVKLATIFCPSLLSPAVFL